MVNPNDLEIVDGVLCPLEVVPNGDLFDIIEHPTKKVVEGGFLLSLEAEAEMKRHWIKHFGR